MKKRKSLVVSLALALLLVFSAPVALLLNRTAAQADDEETYLIDPVTFFVPQATNDSNGHYAPKLAIEGSGLQAESFDWLGKGVLAPLAKITAGNSYATSIKTKDLDITDLSADDPLISFVPVGIDGPRTYRVTLSGGTNHVTIYFTVAASEYAFLKDSSANTAYVQASNQSTIGGEPGGDSNAVYKTFTKNDVAQSINGATGTAFKSGGPLTVYYDKTENAIYTTGTDGNKTLVRSLKAPASDSEEATATTETDFPGFTDNKLTITIDHHSGGGETAASANTTGKYGVVVTALNGVDFSAGFNSLGYVKSYKKVGGSVTVGDYKSEEFTVSTNVATALPALEKATEGSTVTDDEKTGWATKVYNASGVDVASDVYTSDSDTVNFSGVGKYVVVKSKDVTTGEGDDAVTTTHVVTYVYGAIESGFENDYRNIFDYKDGDGDTTVGRAGVNLATDLTTGTSTVPNHAQSALGTTGVMLGYKSVKTENSGETKTDLGKIVARIPSVNISDNTKDDILISATPVPSSDGVTESKIEVSGIQIVVYETADPNNYFVVSLFYYVQTGGHTIHATAAAIGQNAFGTRGATATQTNTVIKGDPKTACFGEAEYKFSYDKDNKAVYINGTLIRDFDADDNTNGIGDSRVKWSGFNTDEVGIMIMNTNGSGNVLVKNVDGNDLTYTVVSDAGDGYTAGLNSVVKTDNYNASIRAAIGSTMTVPAPTSKTITGEFTTRNDITVAKFKVNGGDAEVYTEGTSTFTVAAGVNKIEYSDSSGKVIATAYVYGYNNELANAFTGGTATQGALSPFIGISTPSSALDQLSGSNAASVDGLLLTATRPEIVDANNNKVTVKLNKKLYIGNLGDKPLIDFSMAPEYVSHQLAQFAVVIKDENGNVIRITIEPQGALDSKEEAYIGSSFISPNSPVYVYQNDTSIQLRHNLDNNGNAFAANNFYYGGYTTGKLALYFDSSTQELKVGESNKGYNGGTNEVLCCFNPTDTQKETYAYYKNTKFDNHTFTSLGDTVEMSFEFRFYTDDVYSAPQDGTYHYAQAMAKEKSASVLIRSIAGQSLVQTDNVYTKPSYSGEGASAKIAAKIADVTGSYAVGDALTTLPNAYYFNFFAEGGIESADDYKHTTVKLTDASGNEVTAGEGGTYSLGTFGAYTLTYTFGEGDDARELSTTFNVDVKKITINNNAGDPHFTVTADSTSVGCDDSYRLSNVDGAKAVLKFTPKDGYAIKAIQLGSTDKLSRTLYYDDTDNTYTLTVSYSDGVFTNGSVAIVVTTDKYFTVTFFNVKSDSAVASQRVFSGENASAPTAPTWAGHVFKGWYTDESCTEDKEFAFSSTIDENKTLYAKWVEAYTVTFDYNGGSTVASTGAESGTTITKPNDPTRDHYTFGGWFKEEGLTTEWSFESDTVSSNTTLYAKWTAIEYSIDYELNKGTGASDAPTKYTIETTELSITDPTRTGYTFGGWYTDADLADANAFNYTKGTTTGALTLYAKWTANSFTATFELGYGEAPATTDTIYYDGTVTAPTDPVREGYTFDGWFVDGATTAYDFATTVTGDVTLTAKWTIKTYTVSFSDGVAAQTVNHGGKVTEPTAPTKDGYTFGGWFVGDAADAYDFENATVTSTVTLTAKWTANSFTATFKLGYDGAPADTTDTIYYDGTVTAPTAPVREGYTFDGWFVDGATTAYDFATTVTGDVTLTAKWTAESTAPVTPDTGNDTGSDSDTTAGDNKKDDKEGCGKEAIGLLAVVMSALGAALIIKKH